jgi:hypothetical protein
MTRLFRKLGGVRLGGGNLTLLPRCAVLTRIHERTGKSTGTLADSSGQRWTCYHICYHPIFISY